MGEILLATRVGTSSIAPARAAAELARRLGLRLIVVSVAAELAAVERAGGEAGVEPAAEQERVLRTARTELDAFVTSHLADVTTDVHLVRGSVAEQVTRLAAAIKASYIVVGTRGRGALARIVLGDTTQEILQRTPCPVLVVPLRD